MLIFGGMMARITGDEPEHVLDVTPEMANELAQRKLISFCPVHGVFHTQVEWKKVKEQIYLLLN